MSEQRRYIDINVPALGRETHHKPLLDEVKNDFTPTTQKRSNHFEILGILGYRIGGIIVNYFVLALNFSSFVDTILFYGTSYAFEGVDCVSRTVGGRVCK